MLKNGLIFPKKQMAVVAINVPDKIIKAQFRDSNNENPILLQINK
jgi:hypothetical protein